MLGFLPSPLQVLIESHVNLYSKPGGRAINQLWPSIFMIALLQLASCWRQKKSLKLEKTSFVENLSLASTFIIIRKYLTSSDQWIVALFYIKFTFWFFKYRHTSIVSKIVKERVNYTPLSSKMFELHSSLLLLKYTLISPLIQNILENISLPTLKRNLNYILLPSYVKIYSLLPQ